MLDNTRAAQRVARPALNNVSAGRLFQNEFREKKVAGRTAPSDSSS